MALGVPTDHRELVGALLELWTGYSGLGSRSLHGLGSMGPVGENGAAVEEPFRSGATLMRQYLGLREGHWATQSGLPSYPIVHPDWLRLASREVDG